MAQETVGDTVTALLNAYTTALDHYTHWRERQWQKNHYRTRGTTANSSRFCAANASLTISRRKIEEMLDNGTDVLGNEFVVGDGKQEIKTPFFPHI